MNCLSVEFCWAASSLFFCAHRANIRTYGISVSLYLFHICAADTRGSTVFIRKAAHRLIHFILSRAYIYIYGRKT